jgi:hypothetical protein
MATSGSGGGGRSGGRSAGTIAPKGFTWTAPF